MMRVYLFRGKHPLYETFLTHPPDGVEFLPDTSGSGAVEYTLYDTSSSMIRRLADSTFQCLRIPRCIPIMRRYDLVHSSRGFIVLGPNRYVVDVEHASSFVGMHHARLRSDSIRRTIFRKLKSPLCCRVLPHCEAAMRSLSLITEDKTVLDKGRVLYPAVSSEIPVTSKGDDGNPTLLFMGEYYWKGGREFLKACISLSKKQDFRVVYISLRVHPPRSVVDEVREKMDIAYHEGPVPRRSLLQSIYPSTAIFVMPTYIDTFGYSFLEAMSYGIPCIGTSHFAVPEIIEDGVSGIVVETPLSYFDNSLIGHPEIQIRDADCSLVTSGLTGALDQLLSSANLRSTMGAEGRKQITEGKFSITRRNQILKEVYEESAHR